MYTSQERFCLDRTRRLSAPCSLNAIYREREREREKERERETLRCLRASCSLNAAAALTMRSISCCERRPFSLLIVMLLLLPAALSHHHTSCHIIIHSGTSSYTVSLVVVDRHVAAVACRLVTSSYIVSHHHTWCRIIIHSVTSSYIVSYHSQRLP